MQREIEFRGISKRTNEWVHGDLIHTPEGKVRIIGFTDKSFDGVLDYGDFNIEVDIETTGQYTGLKDKNGTKIFEGDVVVVEDAYPFYSEGKLNYVGVVEFIYNAWQVVFHSVNTDIRGISNGINNTLNEEGFDEISDWKVIGNIHQNKELIK